LFYLTEPKWIWISAGIMIPILIHLAKGRSGKTLSIGSIHLLRENIISQSSSLKIRERLLLFLRCLGIIVAAFFLSSPFWRNSFSTDKKTGWVLVEKNRSIRSLHPYQPLIDSLLKSGFELRLLEEDFPKTRMQDIETTSQDSLVPELPSYWKLLERLGQQVPSDMPLYVFTGDKLSRFSGNRPELSLNLHWTLLETPDTVSSWISSVYATSSDSVLVVNGHSRNTKTWFQRTPLNKEGLSKITTDRGPVPDADTLVVVIFCPAEKPDAGYLQTALEAVRFYTRRRMSILRTAQKGNIPQKADWIFWLSDDPIPSGMNPRNVFQYKTGTPVATHSWIYPAVGSEPSGISVNRLAGSNNDSLSETIWSDGFGRPLLTVDKKEPRTFSFYSRFDPAWNDLPWSAFFPRFIFRLLYPENWTALDRSDDQRKISASQANPVFYQSANSINERKFQLTELSSLFWGLLFIIFCLERLLSWKKKESAHD
jgi:hypothetical protein